MIGGIAVAAIIIRQWWPGRLGVELFYSVLGLAAAVPAISRLFEATGCEIGVEPAVRIVAVLLMAAVWIATLIAALTVKTIGGFRTTASGLALFGALDVILLMSGPIGAGFAVFERCGMDRARSGCNRWTLRVGHQSGHDDMWTVSGSPTSLAALDGLRRGLCTPCDNVTHGECSPDTRWSFRLVRGSSRRHGCAGRRFSEREREGSIQLSG